MNGSRARYRGRKRTRSKYKPISKNVSKAPEHHSGSVIDDSSWLPATQSTATRRLSSYLPLDSRVVKK